MFLKEILFKVKYAFCVSWSGRDLSLSKLRELAMDREAW